VRGVEVLDDRRSHWTVRGPLGRNIEWDAETTEKLENQKIAWTTVTSAAKATEGWSGGSASAVEHEGAVEFKAAPGDRGTEIVVRMSWRPPAGGAGVAIATLLGAHPEREIREDL